MAKWKGPITGHLYPTEVTGNVVVVDLRDVECMLNWQSKSGKPLFLKES